MTQNEVYAKLRSLRNSGDDRYYSVPQIHAMLEKGYTRRSIQMAVKKLSKSRHIEYDADEVLRCLVEQTNVVRKYRAVV